jgi:transcriptional regulator with XRE-family HTH domain
MKRKSMRKPCLPLTEQLRQAVLNCGQSQYAICKATGIDKAALSRFVSGERGVSMTALDALGDYLGLKLVGKQERL